MKSKTVNGALEKKWVDLYLANADIIAEGLPPVINRARAEALEIFNLSGFPAKGSANGDRYHYTDLQRLYDRDFEYYFMPSYRHVTLPPARDEHYAVSFLNGFCIDSEALTRLDNGVIFGSLAAAARVVPELVEKAYNRLAGKENDAITAFNTVFAQDGVFVYVPQNIQVERPIDIRFAYYAEGESLAGFTRNLLLFEPGSQAQILMENLSLNEGAYCDCAVSEISVGERAHIEFVEDFRLNAHSSSISSNYAQQQTDSHLYSLSVALDGQLIRGDRRVELNGAGADNHMDGLMLCSEGQHIDFTTDIRHTAPDCTSKESFRAIASGDGRGIFCGRIYVAPGAQRTQAFQQSNNLLLSENAHIDAKPQLEIYADDVKCSHGATVGQLNEEAVYYMRQRGISEETARRLQIIGFVGQLLGHIPIAAVIEQFETLVTEKIERM